jgi:aminoglycoside phosphotransferase
VTNPLDPSIPPAIADLLDAETVTEQELGRVGNRLIRVRTRDGRGAYLKIGHGSTASELFAEAERLQWIGPRLPVPSVLATDLVDDVAYVLISELDGEPAYEHDSAEAVAALAAAMRAVHSLPVVDNPFLGEVEREMEQAERRLQSGSIDEPAFLEEVGSPPWAVLGSLFDHVPHEEEVFTHGDLCLPNVLLRGGAVSGIVDWALAGVADPHRDFMSAELTIRRNVGEDAIAAFYDAYGRPNIDAERVRFFWLLDQFSTFYEPSHAS